MDRCKNAVTSLCRKYPEPPTREIFFHIVKKRDISGAIERCSSWFLCFNFGTILEWAISKMLSGGEASTVFL